ncbi:MAG: hypothetical protein IPL27_15070 [Lewinellaceae bacterium]|nr:hypothetical protein [Lewinellaceae bacterium]
MKKSSLLFLSISLCIGLQAQSNVSTFIRLDQFGYWPDSKKWPSSGTRWLVLMRRRVLPRQCYEVRRVSDGQSVFSGAPVAWNNGARPSQSGDKGWWFDFSAVTTPGEYYLHDVVKNVSSYPVQNWRGCVPKR